MRKNSLYVRILGGALLLYQGVTLGKSVLADRPENMMMFLIVAVVFGVLGVYFLAVGCKRLFKHEYEDPDMDSMDEEEQNEDEQE